VSTGAGAGELEFLDQSEARILAAAADRIFPADDDSPAASELGAVRFIDRQLAGGWGAGAMQYRHGPFRRWAGGGDGWQSPLTPAEAYRHGLAALDRGARARHGSGFAELGPADQDPLLVACERGGLEDEFGVELAPREFLELLRANVVEGLFSDPRYGGNLEGRGWSWLGFPASHVGYPATDGIAPPPPGSDG
jgi:gluconate 2-dehydrogenase gamma chain